MISPGAIVNCTQTGTTLWVVKGRTNDDRWRLVRRDTRGRRVARVAGVGDVEEVTPAPEFEPGISILVHGEVHDVLRDLGDALELIVPDRSRRTRAGDYLHEPGDNTVEIPKSELVLEDLFADL